MNIDISLLVVAIVIGFLIPLFVLYFRRGGGRTSNTPLLKKTRRQISGLKDVQSYSTRNANSLRMIADSQYNAQLWKEAADSYSTLLRLTREKPDLFDVIIPTRLGISALNAKDYDRAITALLIARSVKESNFEVNYGLGKAYSTKGNHKEAINYLRVSLALEPRNIQAQRLLGLSLARSGSLKDAAIFLEQALASNPQDAASIFHYARSLMVSGSNDRAIEHFKQLENNIQYGPYALLQIGLTITKRKNYLEAVEIFEKALSFPKIPETVYCDLNYHLADSYAALGEYKKSSKPLRDIAVLNPSYKDIMQKIELFENERLHVFMFGTKNDIFKLALQTSYALFPDNQVQQVKWSESTRQNSKIFDLVVRIKYIGSVDHACIRFIRSNLSVQDIRIRELNEFMQANDAISGFCFCGSVYSDLAMEYAESRPIKLYDRTEMLEFFTTLK